MTKNLVTILVALAMSGTCTRAAEPASLSPEQPKQEQAPKPSPDSWRTRYFGGLAKLLVVYLTKTPIPWTGEDIDRLVGSPWELNPDTAAKLSTYTPRLNLSLQSLRAQDMRGFTLQPSPYAVPGVPDSGPRAYIQFDTDTSNRIVNTISSSFESHFRSEELIDLLVYLLAQNELFPKTQNGWNRWKNLYTKYNVALALGVLATQLLDDKINISTSGYIPYISGSHYRIGWYGSLGHLGVSLRPNVHGGFKIAARGLDVSAGVVANIRPKDNQEVISFETDFREHIVAQFSNHIGWDISLALRSHYNAWHLDPAAQGRFELGSELFARRERLFGNDDLVFLLNGKLSSDFFTRVSASGSLSLEDRSTGLSTAVHLSTEENRNKDTHVFSQNFKTGVSLGGSFGTTERAQALSEMRWSARFSEKCPTTKKDFITRLAHYRQARDRYYVLSGGCKQASKEWCGPVTPERLEQLRATCPALKPLHL